MKNKMAVYFLGAAVLLVWSFIVFRVFSAAGGGDDEVANPAVNTIKEAYNDYAYIKDTTRLLLNYRDPFDMVKKKDTAEIPVRLLVRKAGNKITPFKVPMNWGFIQYSGYIKNPSSKSLVTLVSINGKNEMMKEGEEKNQVRLIKNLRDSIKIIYQGQAKFISLKHAAL